METSLLYHEPQVASLCGVHALNTLLQGPFFTEFDLATIAADLDAQERNLMSEGGLDSADFLRYVAEDSGNVAADGNFSIQVLSKALKAWSLHVIPVDSPDAGRASAEPDKQAAFLCNLREHWFTIRKTGDDWYNFNSLYPAPEPLSQFYLGAYLSSLKAEGYTIFVVRGILPDVQSGAQSHSGRWLSKEQARSIIKESGLERQRAVTRAAAEGAMARASQGQVLTFNSPGARGPPWANNPGIPPNQQDEEERQMRAAIAASLGNSVGKGVGSQNEDEELAATIAMSLQTHSPGNAPRPHPTHASGPSSSVQQQDADLAAAIAASLRTDHLNASNPGREIRVPPEPDVGAGVVQLAIRLDTGDRMLRRFDLDTPLEVVIKFLQDKGVSMSGMVLETSYPRAVLPSNSISLRVAGIKDKCVLNVVKKRP
mmetsp:Transcript_33766/g.63599  ORF Transcript_33766/g.63599 Transcript_33766/m.63599 type:complete len:428 (+) Transcript_33766:120-1403(+)